MIKIFYEPGIIGRQKAIAWAKKHGTYDHAYYRYNGVIYACYNYNGNIFVEPNAPHWANARETIKDKFIKQINKNKKTKGGK